MEAFLKIFNQYDIRVNFIPGFTIYYLLKLNGFDYMTDSELEKVILCYVMGMIVSRLGSLLVECSCKKIGFIKFKPYKLYMKACEKNEKIEILSETNNLYRSMVAVFLLDLVYIVALYDIDMGKMVIPVTGFILFLMSYIKQTKYVSKNITNTIDKDKKRMIKKRSNRRMYVEGMVSIITPTYNCGKYIKETIEAVRNQTYSIWEMIIVDDCSSDNTKEIVDSYQQQDSRIKYHCLKENSGAATARTKAMELATGQYMAFLDSDDVWMPDKLEKQIKFMQDNDYAFSSTSYQHMNEEGKMLPKVLKAPFKTDYNRLLLDCPVGNSTVMYDVSKMGKFQVPNIRKRNDDALWLVMLKKERYIYGLPDVLMKYRVRKNSISSNKWSLVKYTWQLYRDIEHLSIFTSVWHICWWGCIKFFRLK